VGRTNLILAGVAVAAGHIVYNWIDSQNTVMADDAKQSRFLRSYGALPFRAGCQTRVSTGLSASAGATGFLNIEPTRDILFRKTLETDLCGGTGSPEALSTVDRNSRSALDTAGCAVLSDELAPKELQITYSCGTRTNGRLTAQAPGHVLEVQIDERRAV
jgi:hypothetical protein